MKYIFYIIFLIVPFITIDAKESFVFFFGKSGAGKTTLMQYLASKSEEFYIPVITVTRSPRADDNPCLFEYISQQEYLNSKKEGKIFIDMEGERISYGYKIKNLDHPEKCALLYGSPFFLSTLEKIEGSFFVLIETEARESFIRGSDSVLLQDERKQINKQLSDLFYDDQEFRKSMDLIFCNRFGDVEGSAELLLTQVREITNQTVQDSSVKNSAIILNQCR